MPGEEVYQIISKAKKAATRLRDNPQIAGPRNSKGKSPQLHHEISNYIHEHGFYHLKLQTLHKHLLTVLSKKEVPTAKYLARLLRDKFAIRYTSIDKANLKYRDPAYDDKRWWISKLLT